jgi:N-acetylated-alpha-linked acidic dipeptidase
MNVSLASVTGRAGPPQGYGVKTLPAVRESIEQKEWKLAEEQIVRVGKVLENAGEAIDGAAAGLTRAVAR